MYKTNLYLTQLTIKTKQKQSIKIEYHKNFKVVQKEGYTYIHFYQPLPLTYLPQILNTINEYEAIILKMKKGKPYTIPHPLAIYTYKIHLHTKKNFHHKTIKRRGVTITTFRDLITIEGVQIDIAQLQEYIEKLLNKTGIKTDYHTLHALL